MRNFFEAGRLFNFGVAAGTLINGAAGGTTNGIELGKAEYHVIGYVGTLANNGTINVYACTNAAGSSPRIVATRTVGSGDGAGAAIDIKSSAIGSLNATTGTTYTHLGAYATVEAGGTWRGALFGLSYNLRVAPPGTTGLVSGGYGTFLV